jgi:hypothetical protein
MDSSTTNPWIIGTNMGISARVISHSRKKYRPMCKTPKAAAVPTMTRKSVSARPAEESEFVMDI